MLYNTCILSRLPRVTGGGSAADDQWHDNIAYISPPPRTLLSRIQRTLPRNIQRSLTRPNTRPTLIRSVSGVTSTSTQCVPIPPPKRRNMATQTSPPPADLLEKRFSFRLSFEQDSGEPESLVGPPGSQPGWCGVYRPRNAELCNRDQNVFF